MKSLTFWFAALFAGAFAVPISVNDDFFGDDVELNSEGETSKENIPDIEDRIIGGKVTTIQEHPHQVSFRLDQRHHCGGSLISATRALTAAHCFSLAEPKWRYSIIAGSTLRNGDDKGQFRQLTRLMHHPKYIPSPYPYTNDIGLLYWVDPLKFSATCRAIALPPQDSPVPNGVKCTVSGWGRIAIDNTYVDHLNVVTIPIVGNEECQRAHNRPITPDMLCAGVPEGGRDFCHGDDGGPLVINKTIIGVVSWAARPGCARPRFPGVYARVPFFTNWIRGNM